MRTRQTKAILKEKAKLTKLIQVSAILVNGTEGHGVNGPAATVPTIPSSSKRP